VGSSIVLCHDVSPKCFANPRLLLINKHAHSIYKPTERISHKSSLHFSKLIQIVITRECCYLVESLQLLCCFHPLTNRLCSTKRCHVRVHSALPLQSLCCLYEMCSAYCLFHAAACEECCLLKNLLLHITIINNT
jgi:hypothetical protein